MTNDKITTMSGVELLERIRKGRAEFASLWEDLTVAEMTQYPGPQDDWSVKDLMVHIVWWENYMIERVGKILAGTDKPVQNDYDAMNARILEENKDRSLEEVSAEFEANLQQVEALITGLTDVQINDPDAVAYGGRQLLKFLISDTFGHYAEHQPDLERYVDQIQSGDDWIHYMSGADLVARIRADRAKFASLWDGLTDVQMIKRPGPQADWSVKDLIAHVTWWEQHFMDWVTRLINNEDVTYHVTVDEVNAHVFADNKDRELSDILTEFDEYGRKVDAYLQTLSDEQINDSNVLSFTGKHSILRFVIGNTWGHYSDHYDDLKDYVARL